MTSVSENNLMELNGGCLCGKVRYQIRGSRRHIINCHCENCRRSHGHVAAYTAVRKQDLVLQSQQSLRWYHDQSPNTYRGFCDQCGSSLFWDARDGNNRISISAGSLDSTRGLRTVGHIFLKEAGDYYDINDDLPKFDFSSNGELESD